MANINTNIIDIETYNNVNLDNLYYENTPAIYLYNQYKDLEYIKGFIDIVNEIIYNELHERIKYWYALKSNATTNIQKYTEAEYFIFFISNYLNLANVFGNPVSNTKWDERIKYDNDYKWDTIESKGIIDAYKMKAFIRWIYDLHYNGWTLNRFIQFCIEVCYETKNMDIWVNDSSFSSVDEIVIYYNLDSTAIGEITDLCSFYKNFLPITNIRFVRVDNNKPSTRARKK